MYILYIACMYIFHRSCGLNIIINCMIKKISKNSSSKNCQTLVKQIFKKEFNFKNFQMLHSVEICSRIHRIHSFNKSLKMVKNGQKMTLSKFGLRIPTNLNWAGQNTYISMVSSHFYENSVTFLMAGSSSEYLSFCKLSTDLEFLKSQTHLVEE